MRPSGENFSRQCLAFDLLHDSDMEPATVEWSSPEIEALIAAARSASRPASVRVRMPCEDETIMWPEPVPTPRPPRRLTPMPTTVIIRAAKVEQPVAMDLVALAWLAVLGFAMGVSGVAVICAIAQRSWL